ncbi:unnamed protein product, partial [Ectocarpus sp. 8 AP-2014]
MSAVLCDTTTSPFLEAATTAGGTTVVTFQRPLLAGLACLGAHEDLGQRALLLSTLVACPSLLGPYLRTFNTAMLEARPTYRLLQTYSLLSTVLRKVPVAGSSRSGEDDDGGGGAAAAGQVLFSTVMPAELNKKELTRGVLSGSPLLQAATMNLMASVLDRASLAVAAAAGSSTSPPGVVEMKRLLRQRMPDLQTLLGL